MKRIIFTLLFALGFLGVKAQDPFVTKQAVSNANTWGVVGGSLSIKGPVWSLMTDTIHAYAIPKYRGALIMRHADSLIYANTGSHWRCVEQPLPVEYPLYVEDGVLKSASGDIGNKLLHTGDITIVSNTLTINEDIIWTFNSQVKTQNVPSIFTVDYADAGLKRVDIVFIDSSDNISIVTGDETAGIAIEPNIDYNGIKIVYLYIDDNEIITIPTYIYDNNSVLYSATGSVKTNRNELSYNETANTLRIGGTSDVTKSIDFTNSITAAMIQTNGNNPLYVNLNGGGSTSFFTGANFNNLTQVRSSSLRIIDTLTSTYIDFIPSSNGTSINMTGNKSLFLNNQAAPNNTFNSNVQFIIGNAVTQTTTRNTTALLDLRSTTMGLLIPRMTSSERDLIGSPATSLLIYNTTTSQFEWYNGSAWTALSGGSSGWGLTGNAISPTTQWFGSTNDSDLIFKRNSVFSGIIGNTNIAFGNQALLNTVDDGFNGMYNVAFGASALTTNTTGLGNIAIGRNALTNSNGPYNVGIGYNSLTNSNATGNVGIGQSSLGSNTSGNYNTAIGYSSLITNTTGSNNTAIGVSSGPSVNNLSSTTAIGYQASISVSNGIAIGNANAKIGMGTSSPTVRLHIAPVAGHLTPVIIDSLGTFADDTAAGVGGLTVGMLYKTSAGVLMIKL